MIQMLAEIDPAHVVMRLLHIVAAAVALGGAAFVRVVLKPALRSAPGEAADAVQESARRRWAILYHLAVVALLVSGLYNYVLVNAPQHRGQASYHALFGVKFILACAVFVIGSALVGRAAIFAGLRQKAGVWMSVNLLLATAVAGIACWLKFIPNAAAN